MVFWCLKISFCLKMTQLRLKISEEHCCKNCLLQKLMNGHCSLFTKITFKVSTFKKITSCTLMPVHFLKHLFQIDFVIYSDT